MKNYFTIIFFLLLFNSCGNSNYVNIPSNHILLNVKKVHKLPKEIFPRRMSLNENLVIITNSIKGDSAKIFDVFDLDKDEILYSFGTKGRSKQEYTISDNSIFDKYLEVVDMNRIKYVNIGDSSASVVDIVTLPAPILNGFGKINDSVYCTCDKISDHNKELTLINSLNREMSGIGNRPKWADSEEEVLFDYTCNRVQNKIAMFYYNYPSFKIMDIDGKNERVFNVNSDNNKFDVDRNKIYFVEAKSTKDFIYVTWVNDTRENIIKNASNGKFVMLIIDWNGNICKSVTVNESYRHYMINDDDSKLYIYSPYNNEAIIEYELSEINKA